jgi:flavin reductase (DIM6/NTAB) family NADH-FMN oxidoreductase RutF
MTISTPADAAPVFQSLDLARFTHEERYKFLMAAVVPRPIALVTTLGANGVLNAAPFSSYICLSIEPALLGIVVALDDQLELKDTHRNIAASGEFVINAVTESMAAQVQRCAERFAPGVSEVEMIGFATLPSMQVKPARIADSPLQFECRLQRAIEFGDRHSTLFVGEVLLAHCAEGLVQGYHIDHFRLNPLGRIAGRRYVRTMQVVDV